MNDIRINIARALERANRSEMWLSRQLGRSDAYINQIVSGRQKTVPYEIRLQIAELLSMDPAELNIALPARAKTSDAAPGMADDGEPFAPPPGSYLATPPDCDWFTVRSNVLDQHEDRIRPGDKLLFDMKNIDAATIRDGSIVLVQLMDRRELLGHHGTVFRVFIAPNKLITNSSVDNDIMSLDDESRPYIAVIKGVRLSHVRDAH